MRTLRRHATIFIIRLIILSFLLQSTAAGAPVPVTAQGPTPPVPVQHLEPSPSTADLQPPGPSGPSGPPPQLLFQPGAIIVPDPPGYTTDYTTNAKPLPSATTPITAPIPVSLTLRVTAQPVVRGLITYTLTITNQSGSPLRGLQLWTVLNQSVHLSTGEPGFYDPVTRLLTVTLPLLPGGATIERSFRTRLAGAPHGNRLHQAVAIVQPGVGQVRAAAETTVLNPVATATVGPAGGTLVSADGRLAVIVPQGALSTTARIEQEWRYVGDIRLDRPERFFVVRLSAVDLASGRPITQFAVPISLTVQAGDLLDRLPAGRSFWLQHYDPGLKQWTPQSGPYTPDPVSGLVTMTTSHFSELGGGELDRGGWRLLFNPPSAGLFNGAIVWSAGIESPPGTHGLGPASQLNYNSGRMNGLAAEIQADWSGLGWGLDGIEITRKLGHGGAIGGIAEPEPEYNDYYASWCAHKGDLCLADEFSLLFGGASYTLVYTGTVSGADIYRTADESFLRVRRIRCDSQCTNGLSGDRAISNQGGYYRPGIGNFRYDYWEVTSQDGTVYRLGARADSEQRKSDVCIDYGGPWTHTNMHPCGPQEGDVVGTTVYRWRVDYVKDVYGNEEVYHYAETKADAQGYTNFNQANDGEWDRESYLDYVVYSWRTSGGGFWGYKLIFDLQCRGGAPSCSGADGINDAHPDYGNDRGRLWFQRKFLRGIQVKQMQDASNGAIIREYRLGYAGSTPIQNSSRPPQRVLASITPYGLNGYASGSALPATTFGYTQKRNSSFNCSPSWDGYQWEYARLTQIKNGYGATIDLGWAADASESGCFSPDKPYTINWLISWKAVRDGLNPDAYTYYSRDWPCYHYDTTIPSHCRRTSSGAVVGFGIVTETLRSGGENGPVLAVSDHRFYPDIDDWSLSWNGQDLGPRLYALNGREKRTRQWGWDAQNNRPSVVLAESQSVYTVIYDSTALYENHSAADDALFIYQDESSQRQNNTSGVLQVPARTASVYELTYGKVITQYQYGLARTVPNGRFAHGLRSWGTLSAPSCSYEILTGNRLAGLTTGKLELKHNSGSTCYYGVYQNLGTAVSLGTTYRVSVRARASVGNGPTFTLLVYDGQNTPATQPVVLSTAWQVVTVTYTTTTVQNLQIRLRIDGGNAGSVYVDDVWYELVSENGDESSQRTTYTSPSVPAWIVGYPSDQRVYTGTLATGTAAAQTTFTYSSLGALTKQRLYKAPGGAYVETEYHYDAWGNQDIITDTRDQRTRIYYDGAYHTYPMTFTNALTQSSYLRYDFGFGKANAATDANGNITELALDAFARVVKVAEPLDSLSSPTMQYYYTDVYTSPLGIRMLRIQTVLRESSSATRPLYEFYSGRGLLMQTRAEIADLSAQAVTNSAYDALGRAVKSYPAISGASYSAEYVAGDVAANWAATQYDILGRTVAVTSTEGIATTTVYDGLTTYVRDGNSHQRSTTVDAYGQLVVSHQYTGTVPGADEYMWATYRYNVLGQLISVADQINRQTTMSYNALGHKLGMVDPDMGSWSYSYDDAGNLLSQVSPNQALAGKRSCLYYDALSRLVGKREVTGSCPGTSSTYDEYYYYDQSGHGESIGRRTMMTSTQVTVEWNYDERGRVLGEDRTIASLGRYSYDYTYDSANRLLTTQLPSGELLSHTYTAAWQPDALTSAWRSYVIDTQYNARGQMTLLTTGSSVATSYSYFETGTAPSYRLKELRTYKDLPGGLDRLKLSYRYDAIGNVKAITETTNSGQVQNFTYDPLDRLQNAWTSAAGTGQYTHTGANAYSYGPAGNIASLAGGGYDYDPQHIHAATHVYRTGSGGTFSTFTNGLDGWTCTGPTQQPCVREQESGTGEWLLRYGGWYTATTKVYRSPENWFDLGDGLQTEFKSSQASGSADFVLQLQDATAGAADGPDTVNNAFGIIATPSTSLRVRCKAGGTTCDQYFDPAFSIQANTWYVMRLQVGNGSSKARVWVWKRDDPSVYAYHEMTKLEWNSLSWYFRGYANTQGGSTVVRLDAYGELMDSSADVYSYRYDANGNMKLRVEGLVAYNQTWDRENRLVSVSYGPITTTARSSYSFTYDPDGTRVLQVAPGSEKTAYAGLQYEETITPTALLVDRFPTDAASWSAESGQWSWQPHSDNTPLSDGYYRQTSTAAGESRTVRNPSVGWGVLTATVGVTLRSSTAAAGIVLRRASNDSGPMATTAGYFFVVSTSGSSWSCGIYKWQGTSWNRRVTGGSGCQLGTNVGATLIARAIGRRLEMVVNGQLVASWVDPDTSVPGPGSIALQTEDGAADFDNVLVYGVTTRSYYYLGSQRVAMRRTYHTQSASGGAVYQLHGDHLGSTSLATNTSGDEVSGSRAWYYPFGEFRGTAPSSSPTDFAFGGQRRTGDLGLYQMGARWYDSRLGRWTSPDTLVPNVADPQSWNRYSYVYNDPLKYRDPNGHFPVIIVAVVAIAVALVVMHANAPPVYAPEANWTPPPVAQDPYYSEKSYFDAAPVTGDASDIWAAVTGRTLFTGEELDVTDRALTVGSAALPLFTGGGVRLGRKFIRGIDNVVPGAAMAVRRITAPIGAQTNVAKALRTEARAIFFGANPRLSQELQVHHRIPLEWAHIFPDADPNRLANLVGLPAAAHDQVSARWNTFRARYHGLGREPTPQEVMDYAAEIESEFGQNYRYIEQP